MFIEQQRINYYCEQLSSEVSDVLRQTENEIGLHSPNPLIASDFSQGRFLSFISKLIKPQKILEVGTFLGYATLCLAEGLCNNGTIYTLEKNESLKEKLSKTFAQSKFTPNIEVIYGSALSIMSALDLGSFDLFFVDAAKKEYDKYYECIVSEAKPGAIMIFDNMLWKGQVTIQNKNGIGMAIHNLNEKIKNDPRVENFILPLRDGLNVITVL